MIPFSNPKQVVMLSAANPEFIRDRLAPDGSQVHWLSGLFIQMFRCAQQDTLLLVLSI